MALNIDSKMEWSQPLLEKAWEEIATIASEEMGLDDKKDLYLNQFEFVTAEQMLDAYSSVGMPIYYKHWSFGKEFNHNFKKYLKGHMGLAYEMVINSNPCINLLMEENLAYMQVMVMAHAGVGHNAVFKNNVYFQDWTNAESIIDYLKFASDYVQMCEERYGASEVEETLDACHAISNHSMDKYQRKHRPKDTEESIARRMLSEDLAKQKELDIVLQQTALTKTNEINEAAEDFSGEENLAYFIMKNAPDLPQWKREILRITYKIANYFSPQGVTKTLNEGYASFCHYYIMQRLEEKGHITSDAYIAFLSSHAGVLYQPSYYSKHYSGPNPYAVGFKIFMDLKRICENPTDEDREYMPHIVGRAWQEVTKEAAFEYRDDSFIMQFMSPKVVRDLKLMTVVVDNKFATVTEVADDQGYKAIRDAFAKSKERINYVPQIHVGKVDLKGDRALNLYFTDYNNKGLHAVDANAVSELIHKLWKHDVKLWNNTKK